MRECVITHPRDGIYVSEAPGLAFWTLLDCVGQSSVCTWETAEDARAYAARHWPLEEPLCEYVPVETAVACSVTAEELARARLGHLLGDLGEYETSEGASLQ